MDKLIFSIILLAILSTTMIIAFICWLVIDIPLKFQTFGCSMYPLITPNSTVYCQIRDTYEVGDMVIYNNTWTNEQMLHRIIYRDNENGLIIIKGDNLNQSDPGAMKSSDILCKIILIERADNTYCTAN